MVGDKGYQAKKRKHNNGSNVQVLHSEKMECSNIQSFKNLLALPNDF
jgi:hypothetical protein